MNSAQILPDCCHIKRTDAHDLAEQVVDAITATGPLCFYIDAYGAIAVQFLGKDADAGFEGFDLVGSYDEESTVAQITEDILAMQREAIT